MTPRDLTDLPYPVREALLRLVEAIQQSIPATQVVTPPGESSTPGRFPRQALEQLLLDTLEAHAPIPYSPLQLSKALAQPPGFRHGVKPALPPTSGNSLCCVAAFV